MMRQFVSDVFDRLTWPLRQVMSQPMRLFTAPRKRFGFSLPARLALFSFLLLLTCVIIGFCVFYYRSDAPEFRAVWDTKKFIAVAVLLIVIPILVHRLTWMWLDGETSRYPEIDHAWDAGVRALKDQGLDLCDVPLFVVLGPTDDKQARALMQASGRNFSINCIPDAAGPLHWFCDGDSAFLVLTGTSRVAALALLTPNVEVSAPGRPASSAGAPKGNVFTATAILPSDIGSEAPEPEPSSAPPPSYGGGANMTLQASSDEWRDLSPVGSATYGGQKSSQRIAQLPDQKGRDIDSRLLHVVRRLRAARQPFCPINGILSMLPFHLILSGDAQSLELQKSVRSDIDLLQDGLRLRCPVSVMVGGMEAESGFRVLARRIGRDKVKASRFGKGNDSLWTPPTPENVEAVARHACGAFEDWVYHLFSTSEGLTRTDNGKLYSILCLVRTELQERLINLLCGGYGREQEESMLFGGCYFAATGAEEDRQAFVKAVFDKLVEQEEQLSWTLAAVAENSRYARWARVGHTVNLGLVIALVVMVLSSPLHYKPALQKLLPGSAASDSEATK